MIPYSDINGDSGVASYQIGDLYIIVQFRDGWSYEYTYLSAGATHIENMKRLASSGDGLNSYINNCARKAYSRKF